MKTINFLILFTVILFVVLINACIGVGFEKGDKLYYDGKMVYDGKINISESEQYVGIVFYENRIQDFYYNEARKRKIIYSDIPTSLWFVLEGVVPDSTMNRHYVKIEVEIIEQRGNVIIVKGIKIQDWFYFKHSSPVI